MMTLYDQLETAINRKAAGLHWTRVRHEKKYETSFIHLEAASVPAADTKPDASAPRRLLMDTNYQPTKSAFPAVLALR